MGYAIDLLYVPAEAEAAPASMIYYTNTSINVNGAAIRACGIIILKQKLRRRTGLHKLLHKAAALKLVPVRQPSAVLGAAGGHRGCAARPGAIAGAEPPELRVVLQPVFAAVPGRQGGVGFGQFVLQPLLPLLITC